MPHYEYLIIGGGITADSAVKGIRELDPSGTIGVLSIEPDPPYDRPPLSKGMWKGKPRDKILRHTADKGAELHLKTRAVSLDTGTKTVTDDKGAQYTYDKLLYATGGKPLRLPFAGEDIMYFRTLQDYERLRAQADQKNTIGVIGGGYIGSELAAALAMYGKQVVMILLEETINGAKFPRELGDFLNRYFRERGVEVRPQESVTGIERRGERYAISTRGVNDSHTHEYQVDVVVAGLGLKPNVELAQAAGLEVDNGVLVDEHLRTTAPDVYAAGDVASAYRPLLGKRMRIEHEDNANAMGRAAGHNMAGANEKLEYQPYFYSDLFDLGYEAVGELGANMEKVQDWQEPFKKGVIYYLDHGRVRGVVLWDVWKKLDAARALMAEPGPFQANDLYGRIS